MKLEGLQRAIGHRFARLELLEQAVTHRSFGSPHNERLEFLGDSVLNCVTALALFGRFAELREGDLSRLRANLVRQEALHRLADSLNLGDYLRLGEGELKSGGHRRPSILADALEAIFAAVYIDAGFEAAKAVIDRLYAPSLAALDPARALKDPKTALQEWLQGRRMALPRYSLADTRGEAHQQEFEVECEIAGLGLKTRGIGVSRRAAEQQSAQRALELLPKQ
ncbi:ribonuclease III [Zoogloea sp.]|uniref:ribonuclease III n=1 Tax=Zoogloea sp. TaxID=49181 RepID=UPI001AD356D5|nr:ribonuclease III [Zoogloea sp.]MBK7846645.1 ribonuclease III [Zoogloea sp.]MBN8283697.1 ribonuclease III [Zoogloea sp.]